MSELSRVGVEQALKQVVDPYLEQDLVTAQVVKKIDIDESGVALHCASLSGLGIRSDADPADRGCCS